MSPKAVRRPKPHHPGDAPSATLEESVAVLRGVGPRIAERLMRLGVRRIGDLLCLLPVRYEDRTELRRLGSLRPGEKVLVEGRVELAEVIYRGRRSLLCRIADGTGAVTLRFFHFSRAQHDNLVRGATLRCFGEVRAGPTGLEMVHPEYRVVGPDTGPPSEVLTPVYPTTEGLHQQRLRSLMAQALDMLEQAPLTDYLADRLPADAPRVDEALQFLHGPPQGTELEPLSTGRHPCQRRIALEELVAQRLSLLLINVGRQRERATALATDGKLVAAFRQQLPFTLTGAQDRVLAAILKDLQRDTPMHRLLQGDVGSGKTVVAAAAAVVSAANGWQTAVMAPTELLAEQHYANFRAWLEPLDIRVASLTGSVAGAERPERLEAIATGDAQVIVGTHALFQQDVRFHHLALVVVDEQHRFGVDQRLELRLKGKDSTHSPHQLVMTATPIPRTLAMTAFADLDCSVIDELPAGRRPVRTVVMPEGKRPQLVQRVLAHCQRGEQAYWVCPLIEESEAVDSQAAEQLEQELRSALPELKVALLHGRMKSAAKDRVMRSFKEGEIDLLVATTVIEVGVDVPNATLMVVENSERMGLAQLHQLRGRVGRGAAASSCVLLYKSPLSELARERLGVMRKTTDGFEVAQKDLELRGPGEVLGTRQTGMTQLKIANLVRDADLLPEVIRLSDELIENYPQRVEPLIERWLSGQAHYAKV
ncbi:MAG: ATP-dependent DNA helicase RecG [Gammaproteobacteria bacterium]